MVSIINGPVTALLVAIGLLLNVTTVFVLLRSPKRSRATNQYKRSSQFEPTSYKDSIISSKSKTSSRPFINTYLLWLAISDTALLLSAFLMYSLPTFISSRGSYAHLFPTCYMLSNATLTASVWLMCALMFERYRALCRPLSTQTRPMNTSRIHLMLACIVFFALIFSLPRHFELAVYEYDGRLYVRQTFLVDNRIYMIGYRIIGGLFFYSLFPYIGLFMASARISLALHVASKERQRMAANSNKTSMKADAELILLAVMAKFLLSRLMPTALDVAEHIVSSNEFLNSSTATLFVDISNLLVVLSSANNFIIYFALSKSFRRSTWLCMPSSCCARFSTRVTKRRFAIKRVNSVRNFRSENGDVKCSSTLASRPPCVQVHQLAVSVQTKEVLI